MHLLSINSFLKLSLLFAVLQLSNALYAQGICYDFESTCTPGGPAALEPFFSGCIPDWNSAYGTPDLREGSAYMGLWENNCMNVYGEGIVLNIPFTGCVDIQFNYRTNDETNISTYTVQLFAITGAFPGATSSNNCDGIIPAPGGSLIWETTGENLQIDQTYTAIIEGEVIPANTQQLWFRIAPSADAELVNGDHANIYIDNFCYLTCDFCEKMEEEEQANEDCSRPDASFDLEVDVDQGIYTFYPENFDTFDHLLGEHSWRVLTSGSPNGPYQSLRVFATEDFPIEMEDGLFYTVIHTVNYICGEFCYLQRTCSSTYTCGDCGPICCDTEFDMCSPKAPTNLRCTYNAKKGTVLSWNAISDAASYEVDFVEVIDPTSFPCFGPGSGQYDPTVDATVIGNSIPQPANISNCYTFRVRAICNGAPGEWSIPYSITGPCQDDTGGDEPDFPGIYIIQGANGNHTSVYPNPSSTFFNIVIPQSEEAAKVRVFDFSGREVYQKALESNQEEPLTVRWMPSPSQNKGIYLVLIEQGENRTTHKIILE